MTKRILSLILFVAMCCLFTSCSCSNNNQTETTAPTEPSTVATTAPTEPPKPKKVTCKNPLTGKYGLSKAARKKRPVAIMVNNLSTAQTIQTGLNKADIVYETEVEGGITRLLAVYQDFSKVKMIGSIRSSRYAYIDLAAGHNAIYAYHGIDTTYAQPHLSAVSSIQVGSYNGAARIQNGLAYEHTLYVYPDKVWSSIKSMGLKTTADKVTPWQSFAPLNKPVKLSHKAKNITVPFSQLYHSTFKYNASTKKYIRYFNGVKRKDYKTGKSTQVKNLFVLNTTIQTYPDGYHRNVSLSSGTGYYFVNGTYTQINWSKGNASDKLKFTDKNGNPLKVNPGSSWVCIANSATSKPVIS